MKYQINKIDVIDCSRRARGTSQFSTWVKTNYDGKFALAVQPIDTDGNFSIDPLKKRGYEFSGAGTDRIERGLLFGEKVWFKIFDSEDQAFDEETLLTETGI